MDWVHGEVSPRFRIRSDVHLIGCGFAGDRPRFGEKTLLTIFSPLVECEMILRGHSFGTAEILVDMPTGERGIDDSFVTQRFVTRRQIRRAEQGR